MPHTLPWTLKVLASPRNGQCGRSGAPCACANGSRNLPARWHHALKRVIAELTLEEEKGLSNSPKSRVWLAPSGRGVCAHTRVYACVHVTPRATPIRNPGYRNHNFPTFCYFDFYIELWLSIELKKKICLGEIYKNRRIYLSKHLNLAFCSGKAWHQRDVLVTTVRLQQMSSAVTQTLYWGVEATFHQTPHTNGWDGQ